MPKFKKGTSFKISGKSGKKAKRSSGGGGLSFNFGANVRKKGGKGGGS